MGVFESAIRTVETITCKGAKVSEGLCKLCDQKKELIQAHIIQDWAFRFLKQDGHFFQVNSEVRSRKLQTGFFDSNILCRVCDGNVIGKYDTYAKHYLNPLVSQRLP